MPYRRSHNKSRHGCTTCKRRRVKCDETRPACVNCSQRKETCVYSAPGPYFFAGKASKSGSRSKSASVDESPDDTASSAQQSLPDGLEQSFHANATTDPPELNMQQLELVLQWMQHTHRLLARNEETRHVWEVLVLQEALTAPFLMHGILALSALHLSHLRQDTQQVTWFNIAIDHKSAALSMFSEQLDDISQSNAKAMMSFAALAVAFSFATTLNSPTPEDRPSLSALTGVFSMSRGVQAVVSGSFDFLRQSSFAPLFDVIIPDVSIPEDTIKALDLLEQLVRQETQHMSEHIAGAYQRPIAHMRDLAAFTYAEPTSMTLGAGWAIRASADYLEDIHTRQPLSLVVLAHYCAFLHMARENWCIGHWGQTVLEEILEILSPEWHVHVDWAVRQVF